MEFPSLWGSYICNLSCFKNIPFILFHFFSGLLINYCFMYRIQYLIGFSLIVINFLAIRGHGWNWWVWLWGRWCWWSWRSCCHWWLIWFFDRELDEDAMKMKIQQRCDEEHCSIRWFRLICCFHLLLIYLVKSMDTMKMQPWCDEDASLSLAVDLQFCNVPKITIYLNFL